MAQGRSTKIITMITWIRNSRLSIKHSLSLDLVDGAVAVAVLVALVQAGPISAAKLTDLYRESSKSTYG